MISMKPVPLAVIALIVLPLWAIGKGIPWKRVETSFGTVLVLPTEASPVSNIVVAAGVKTDRVYPEDHTMALSGGMGELTAAEYVITNVLSGELPLGPAKVFFVEHTEKGPLPTNALLLLTGVIENTGEVLGLEAWRGIRPDTPKNRARLKGKKSESLGQTPPGGELPLESAVRLAWEQAVQFGVSPTSERPVEADRAAFGWVISLWQRTPRSEFDDFLELGYLAVVSDAGYVYQFFPFGHGRLIPVDQPDKGVGGDGRGFKPAPSWIKKDGASDNSLQ